MRVRVGGPTDRALPSLTWRHFGRRPIADLGRPLPARAPGHPPPASAARRACSRTSPDPELRLNTPRASALVAGSVPDGLYASWPDDGGVLEESIRRPERTVARARLAPGVAQLGIDRPIRLHPIDRQE